MTKPLITLDVQENIDVLTSALSDFEKRQIPFAASRALNDVAYQVSRKDLPDETSRAFDRPTKATQAAFVYEKHHKSQAPAVLVKVKEEGAAPIRWLAPEIYGGDRRATGFERALQRSGILKAGWIAVPAGGAALDQHGNVARGHYARILTDLRVNQYSVTATKRGKARKMKREGYFAVFVDNGTTGGWQGWGAKSGRGSGGKKLPPGIYYRAGHTFRMVFLFVDTSANYEQRLRFHDFVVRRFNELFPARFKVRMEEAIASSFARRR